MRKRFLLTLLMLVCLVALLLPMTVSAEEIQTPDGWVQNSDGTWCYYQDGQAVANGMIKDGTLYYAFDENGIMFDNVSFWLDGNYYRAKAGGSLYVNTWTKQDGRWYYYGAEGKAPGDFLLLNNVWYFFYGDGMMAEDEAVWSADYNSYYAISEDGAGYQLLDKAGWTQAFGNWYYMKQEDAGLSLAQGEVLKIDGSLYYFEYNHVMASDVICDVNMGEVWETVYIAPSGAILTNGWAQSKYGWHYADAENGLYGAEESRVYEIGSELYYFEEGTMYDLPGEVVSYYDGQRYFVRENGSLYRNQWYQDTLGWEGEFGWAYYGEDGSRCYDCFMKINGVNYYFNAAGIMEANCVIELEDGVYVFDKDGKGAPVEGWFKHPQYGYWMYAQDGYILRDCVTTLDEKTYAFEDTGEMVANDCKYDYEAGVYYLFDANGEKIVAAGWHKVDGYWYYVEDSTGCLAVGWKTLDGVSYYLCPDMAANTILESYEDGKCYIFNNDGVATALSGNGFRQLADRQIYLENGEPVYDSWRYINGAWYYFAGYYMYSGGTYEIDGTLYLFDNDGKMYTQGWLQMSYRDVYYAGSDGVALTGLQTIGGKQYLFDGNGWLYTNGVIEFEENYYWLNSDGSVRAKMTQGWNQIGNQWYYLEGNELLRNSLIEYNGAYYGFDSEGVMCTNGIKYAWYDYYIFDKDGKILTGWQKIDGKWYYADPESSDPCIYQHGVYYIDGEDYLFKDGYMQTGTVYMDGMIFVTDSSGAIVDYKEHNEGWNYVDGGYVYIKNGRPYTGWVGDYYVRNGDMLANEAVEYNGKYYYLTANGTYAKNGWIKLDDMYNEVYIYAKADGTLCSNEWLLHSGVYYYFDSCIMVNGPIEIDGVLHNFNKDGAWLGEQSNQEPTYPAMSDGWHKVGSKWYYYHAGKRCGGTRYIDGAWYAFSYSDDYAMVANDFYDNYYYGASGARAAYTGWKMIDGERIYFNADYSVRYGWVKYESGWYFITRTYDEADGVDRPICLKNTGMIYDGALYIFDAGGYSAGVVTRDGWHQAGDDWYYVSGGQALRDTQQTIGGLVYRFDYDGVMVKNMCYQIETIAGEGMAYFDASGKMITKTGWYQIGKKWVYVGTSGLVYANGIYRIGGTEYSFVNGYWVE